MCMCAANRPADGGTFRPTHAREEAAEAVFDSDGVAAGVAVAESAITATGHGSHCASECRRKCGRCVHAVTLSTRYLCVRAIIACMLLTTGGGEARAVSVFNRSRKRKRAAEQQQALAEDSSGDEGGRQQASSREPVYLAMPFAKISGVIHCVPRAPKNRRTRISADAPPAAAHSAGACEKPSSHDVMRLPDVYPPLPPFRGVFYVF